MKKKEPLLTQRSAKVHCQPDPLSLAKKNRIIAILSNACTQLTDSKVSSKAYSILMQRSSCYGHREELHLQRESVKQERQSGIAFSPHCTQLEYLNQHSPHSRDLYFTFRLPPYRFNFPIVVVVVITTSGLDRQIII